MKKVAISQSNYLPWKGYFDLLATVDEFILYDEVQFTKNDWRNRNKIKTPQGVQWMSVPVGRDLNRRICDVILPDSSWQAKHWKTLECNYRAAAHFLEVASVFEPLYTGRVYSGLSELNRKLIEAAASYLGVQTRLSSSSDYPSLSADRNERLVSLCLQAGAVEYVSGPAAKAYLDTSLFASHGIKVTWYDYSGYRTYPQLWGPFVHEVSILDMLFNCGPQSASYMKCGRP